MARKLVVPHPRDLQLKHPYMRGKDVLALQRALAAAHAREWGNFTEVFGAGTQEAVKDFQKKVRLDQSGIYGRNTHNYLARYYDNRGVHLVLDSMVSSVEKAQKALLQAVTLAYNNEEIIHYGEPRWAMLDHHVEPDELKSVSDSYRWADCSSFATWAYWAAKQMTDVSIPDPNNQNWRAGYTGTLAANGLGGNLRSRIWTGEPAAAPVGALYFNGSYPFHHVTVGIGHGMCVSHGAEHGPIKLGIWDCGSDMSLVMTYPGIHWKV